MLKKVQTLKSNLSFFFSRLLMSSSIKAVSHLFVSWSSILLSNSKIMAKFWFLTPFFHSNNLFLKAETFSAAFIWDLFSPVENNWTHSKD